MGDDFEDVYIAPQEYVKVGMKQTVAKRMTGWLFTYANYADVAGNTQSAEDARAVAERIEHQLEEVRQCES